jgi:hypothetical protein
MRRLSIVMIAGLLFACHDVTDPPKTTPGVTAFVAPDSAPADGKTQVLLRANADTSLAATERKVKFKTTAGSFGTTTETEVVADSGASAAALLTAPTDSTLAILSATLGSSTITRSIRFTRALPERVSISPERPYVQRGVTQAITVKATLWRSVGTPSPGSVITFTAIDSNGATRGRFGSITPVGASGDVTTSFTTGDTLYVGLLRLIARTTGRDGTISDTAIVSVTP